MHGTRHVWHIVLGKSGARYKHLRARTHSNLPWLRSFFPRRLTLKYTIQKSISFAWNHEFCPTTRRHIPWLSLCYFTAAAAAPAFSLTSSAPEAGRHCIGRLRKARPPWSSSWSLRGPRWTQPTDSAVASEEFSSCFGSDLWRDDGRGSYSSWFSCFALGCWVVLGYLVLKDPLLWSFVRVWAVEEGRSGWGCGTRKCGTIRWVVSSVVLTEGKGERKCRIWDAKTSPADFNLHIALVLWKEQWRETCWKLKHAGRCWVQRVLSTQGFAREDASQHAQRLWCFWYLWRRLSRPSWLFSPQLGQQGC